MKDIALVVFLVAIGITVIVGYNLMERQSQIDIAAKRNLALQQIDNDKLNPMMFQFRCGDAPSRKRTYDGLVISYPTKNVSVGFLVDHGKGYGFKRVDYFSMQPLVPITLSEAVSRLDCSPK